MRWTLRKFLGVIAVALTVIAAIFTIIDTPLGWWNWFSDGVNDGGSVARNSIPTVTPIPQTVTPIPQTVPAIPQTVTPTPTPSLTQMLRAAESVRATTERDRALRIFAETAVEKSNSGVAIRAGAGSPTSKGRSETLRFVALCAAKDGLFKFAVEAADKIPLRDIHDSTKIKILNMESQLRNCNSIQADVTALSQGCR